MKARFFNNGRWYYHFPEYINNGGEYCDLEMVAGADVMLDILSECGEDYECYISENWMKDWDACLIRVSTDVSPLEGSWSKSLGANYHILYSNEMVGKGWLCEVTHIVFGKFPDTLFIKTIK